MIDGHGRTAQRCDATLVGRYEVKRRSTPERQTETEMRQVQRGDSVRFKYARSWESTFKICTTRRGGYRWDASYVGLETYGGAEAGDSAEDGAIGSGRPTWG